MALAAFMSNVFDTLGGGGGGTVVGISAAIVVIGATAFLFVYGQAEVKGKKTAELSGGGLDKDKVQEGWVQYDKYFNQNKGSHGTGVAEKKIAPQFVDTFYNLVTDIYEWGWGQSFHFSPALPGKSNKQSTRIHEEYVCELLKMKPGMKVLDAGCGVGGPMRAIAAKSGSNVVGITINEYQVKRAIAHNKRANLDHICDVVQGNFLSMPFPDNTFDAVYSIEATCHAPKVQDVYAEIFRVLKPGQTYATYEWVTTQKYDAKNETHAKIIDEICYGNALPHLRTFEEIAEAAKEVGFEILENRDLMAPPSLPWWSRLKFGRIAYARNHILVAIVSFLGIAPKGLVEVHNMLVHVAVWLTQGGETGIFTPAHLLLLRKPLNA